MKSNPRVLIVGLDLVPLARSARNAGYEVSAVDHFGDVDLQQQCVKVESIIGQRKGISCGYLSRDFSPQTLVKIVEKVWKKWEADFLLVSSGFEDAPEALKQLYKFPVVGNTVESIAGVREKASFYRKLKKLGITHPKTFIVENLQEAKRACKDLGYPAVLKPEATLGGAGIRCVSDAYDLENAFKRLQDKLDKVIVQEYVSGLPISVSLISSGKDAAVLTVNEQLLGLRFLGAKGSFSYCGNTVPATLSTKVVDMCVDFSLQIAKHFGLLGSNGVDLVVSKEGLPHVVEVNPRFQGSLECVEHVSGVNIVSAHVAACREGRLPQPIRRRTGFCTRLILYAPRKLVAPDLSGIDGVRDVPLEGVVIEEGEPFCSVISYGKTGNASLKNAKDKAYSIYRTAASPKSL